MDPFTSATIQVEEVAPSTMQNVSFEVDNLDAAQLTQCYSPETTSMGDTTPQFLVPCSTPSAIHIVELIKLIKELNHVWQEGILKHLSATDNEEVNFARLARYCKMCILSVENLCFELGTREQSQLSSSGNTSSGSDSDKGGGNGDDYADCSSSDSDDDGGGGGGAGDISRAVTGKSSNKRSRHNDNGPNFRHYNTNNSEPKADFTSPQQEFIYISKQLLEEWHAAMLADPDEEESTTDLFKYKESTHFSGTSDASDTSDTNKAIFEEGRTEVTPIIDEISKVNAFGSSFCHFCIF